MDPASSDQPAQHPKILLVDDDSDILSLLTEFFEEYQFQVRTAPNASAALKLLEKDRMDAILSDLNMPGLDGFSFLQRVRNMPANKRTRLFILTGALSVFERAEDRIASLGISGIFHKPVHGPELVAAVKAQLPIGYSGRDYDNEVTRACVSAVRSVVEHYFMEQPQIQKTYIKESTKAFGYVTALIPLRQPPLIHCTLGFSCDKDFLQYLHRGHGNAPKVDLSEDFIFDILGELSHKVSLKLHEYLRGVYTKVDIGSAEVIIGENFHIRQGHRNPSLVIPFIAKHCLFEASFSMSQHFVRDPHASGDLRDILEDGILIFPE